MLLKVKAESQMELLQISNRIHRILKNESTDTNVENQNYKPAKGWEPVVPKLLGGATWLGYDLTLKPQKKKEESR